MAGKNATRFARVLEPRLVPVLRADGFTSQHNGWIRLGDPVINWLDVQSRSDDEACCVNLGVHLTFLPPHQGSEGSTIASEIAQGDCELSYRLTWNGECDHWWPYDLGAEAAADLVICYEGPGRALFERFASFPDPFVNISPDNFDDAALSDLLPLTETRKLLLLTRIHDYLGNAQFAVRFSEMGLDVANKIASGPRYAFKNILRKHGAPVPKGR